MGHTLPDWAKELLQAAPPIDLLFDGSLVINNVANVAAYLRDRKEAHPGQQVALGFLFNSQRRVEMHIDEVSNLLDYTSDTSLSELIHHVYQEHDNKVIVILTDPQREASEALVKTATISCGDTQP
jgi:hypothetical protein